MLSKFKVHKNVVKLLPPSPFFGCCWLVQLAARQGGLELSSSSCSGGGPPSLQQLGDNSFLPAVVGGGPCHTTACY